MSEQIIPIHEVLLDAYHAANAGRSEIPQKYQGNPIAEHRWIEQYNARAGELARQQTAA
jgi:hypothetical protein